VVLVRESKEAFVLVLSRKLGESFVIVIGGVECWVIVQAIRPGAVRLALAAPPEVKFLRDELHPEGPARRLARLVKYQDAQARKRDARERAASRRESGGARA